MAPVSGSNDLLLSSLAVETQSSLMPTEQTFNRRDFRRFHRAVRYRSAWLVPLLWWELCGETHSFHAGVVSVYSGQ